ncbi:hypothetical protein NP284_01505 [Rhodopseudomonas pseudopalustris]|uniref:hypothetical protein n=1 Tax=Rhodopseudomonas pseudopalustris TaxID=1513892 RepID=UPI003F9AEECF
MQSYQSHISFKCPECAQEVACTIYVPEPNWMADRASDMTAEDETDFTCPECQFPFEGYVFNQGGHCHVTINGYPGTKVEASHAFYDGTPNEDEPWLDFSVPDDPYSIFMDTYHETGDLLARQGGDGTRLINRMIFSQQITALEAYLCDTLINSALSDKKAIERLLAEDLDLKDAKFTLKDILSDPNIVSNHVMLHLKSVLYHNIARVRVLYKIVFQFDIFDLLSSDEKNALFKAVEYRHDCVHRNGRNKEGELLDVFTKEYVQSLSKMLLSLVGNIEKKRVGDVGSLAF